MADPRSNRRRTILVLLVLMSLTLITVDTRGGDRGVGARVRNAARDAFAPIQGGVDGILKPVKDWWDGVTRASAIKAENRSLRSEVQSLRGKVAEGEAARAQNRQFKALEHLPYAPTISNVGAQIVLGSPGNFEATVVLNKGSDDGVGRDMPVVSGEGLLGRVARVSRREATVLLLTDRDSGVGVRDVRSGARGVLNGSPDSAAQSLDLVDARADMKPGDELVTVGSAAGPFPPDIPVARIESVLRRPGDLSARVTVKLSADAVGTSFVRILRWPVP